ncbi:hypothetical protein [Persicitalea sp.]|uniref:hypothetical protein n=1 Tax=Persicitalea sp. TaxID=3100273 RepID=UPI00359414F3
MRNPSLSNDLPYLNELRAQLLTRIAEAWESRWAAAHGSEFVCVEDLPSRNAFYEDLLLDIDQTLSDQLGTRSADYFISKDTLRRFLNPRYGGGFGPKTKNALAIYGGYADWEEFVRQYAPEPAAPSVNIYQIVLLPSDWSASARLLGDGPTVPPVWQRRGMVLTGVFAMLMLTAAGGFALYDFVRTKFLAPPPDQFIKELYSTVREANDAEFAAYRNVPETDLNTLEKYFDPKGSAYGKIKESVLGNVAKKRIICNPGNPSTHELLSISLSEINGDEALVKTRE